MDCVNPAFRRGGSGGGVSRPPPLISDEIDGEGGGLLSVYLLISVKKNFCFWKTWKVKEFLRPAAGGKFWGF